MCKIQQHANGAVVFKVVMLINTGGQLQIWQHGDQTAVGESKGGEDVVDLATLSDVLDQEAIGNDLLDTPELRLVSNDGAVINIECDNGQVVALTSVDAQV